MTLTNTRALVRRDLKDEDATNYRWTDNEIDRALSRALYELSRYTPREMKSTLATTNGSPNIDISTLTDRVSVDRVEFPVDETPRVYQRFTVYQDTITLIGDAEGDGTNAYIYWGKVHTLDGSTDTVPTLLQDILALGAAAYAVLAQAQYRSDVAGIGGDRADTDYQSWGKSMLKEFTDQLKRFGTGRKLKPSQLYPATDYEGTDYE
jgi:hypothetical protein